LGDCFRPNQVRIDPAQLRRRSRPQLSGGEQQRVALDRAPIVRPDVASSILMPIGGAQVASGANKGAWRQRETILGNVNGASIPHAILELVLDAMF
jgi:hypothetical protein